MNPTTDEVRGWVDLVSTHGAAIVITGIAIMLVTWSIIFIVTKLFGSNGLVSVVADRLFGEDGLAEQIVKEHREFVQSVSQSNVQTTDMIKGAMAMSKVQLEMHKDTQELLAGCGQEFCAVIDTVADRLGMQKELDQHLRSIESKLGRHMRDRRDNHYANSQGGE